MSKNKTPKQIIKDILVEEYNGSYVWKLDHVVGLILNALSKDYIVAPREEHINMLVTMIGENFDVKLKNPPYPDHLMPLALELQKIMGTRKHEA